MVIKMRCSVVLLFVLLEVLSVATARVHDTIVKPVILKDWIHFTCNKKSPVSEPVFSNTKPQVALTHIFCGQINEKDNQKIAEGFHSRPGNIDPTCAKIEIPTYMDLTSYWTKPYCVKGVTIYGIQRPTKRGRKYCFFPTKWSLKETVEEIIKMYQRCKGTVAKGNKLCIRNYYEFGNENDQFDVVISLDNSGNVVSAYPTGLSREKSVKWSCLRSC